MGPRALFHRPTRGQPIHGSLPVDNEIPRLFAERLRDGHVPTPLIGDWLSSDRPPLQSGVILLGWPLAQFTRADAATAAHGISLWLQLAAIPATWALVRSLRLPARSAVRVVAVASATGFFYLHSTFTWPKLVAGAFCVGAYLLWRARPTVSAWAGVGVGAFAGLAWVSHGGSAFALAAFAGLLLLARPWPRVGWCCAAALAFLLCALPWTAYQKRVDPPGTRLLKWHLGGAVPIDNRGVAETIISGYREAGWSGTWVAKKSNLIRLIHATLELWVDTSLAKAGDRRREEFFYFV